MSRHLWEAPSSFDFSKAWEEKPHFTISTVFIENMLKEAIDDDIDDLGRLVMVVYAFRSDIYTYLSCSTF